MASELSDLQRYIVGAARRIEPVAADGELSARARELFCGSEQLSPVEQIDVYREQFWQRHVPVLANEYPTARHLLGPERFEALVRAYLVAHPPTSFDLRELAHALAAFVSANSPWCDDLVTVDAVRLDRAFNLAFVAVADAPFDSSVIAAAPEDAWAHARIALQPSISLLALENTVDVVRLAVRRGESPPPPEVKRVSLVVYRGTDLRIYSRPIDALAFELLASMARGEELGAACDALAQTHGLTEAELGPKVGEWFQQWTSYGWVSAVRFDRD